MKTSNGLTYTDPKGGVHRISGKLLWSGNGQYVYLSGLPWTKRHLLWILLRESINGEFKDRAVVMALAGTANPQMSQTFTVEDLNIKIKVTEDTVGHAPRLNIYEGNICEVRVIEEEI